MTRAPRNWLAQLRDVSLAALTAAASSPLALTALGAAALAPPAAAAEPGAPVEEVEGLPVYEVQRGDTLAKIAIKATGDSLRFRELIQYNQGVIADPNDIEVGMRLRLPPGWKLPGAKVPAGERVQANPPPPPTDRAGLRDSPRGAPTTGTFGGKPPMPSTLVTDSGIDAAPPNAHPIDLFTFFPELGRLDEDFELLMLRAAYSGDITWAAKTHASNREEEKELLEQRIIAAEQGVKMQEARYDACKQAKIAAEALLRKYRISKAELQTRSADYMHQLEAPLLLEHKIWTEVLWHELPNEATQIWADFGDAFFVSGQLSKEALGVAAALHEQMKPYRIRFEEGHDVRDPETGEIVRQPWTPEEAAALAGNTVQKLLWDLEALSGDEAYHKELVESERYDAALQSIAAEPECKRGLVDAELFLKEQGRKLRTVEEAVSRGDSDSIAADAERIARRYQAALGEVQLVDAFLSNDVWTSLWWKSGVALRLAGHTPEGTAMIEQAAAVDFDHLLPADLVPPSIQTWFTAAESVIRAKEQGGLDITVHPDMHLTIDGIAQSTQFGNVHIYLKPGIHRVVFWFDGSDPRMKLIGVVEGEDHSMVWYEPWTEEEGQDLDGEQRAMVGDRPVPLYIPKTTTKHWFGGVTGVGGVSLGRPMGGADLTVRYMPRLIGGQVGGAILVPVSPLWVGIDEQLNLFGRVHASVVAGKRWSRFGLIGGLGVFADPLLSVGPLATLEASVRVAGSVRIGLDVRGGYDLMPHFDGVPRWTLTGGIGVWF